MKKFLHGMVSRTCGRGTDGTGSAVGGNDTLDGGAGRDYITVGSGNDTLSATGGNNYLDGGDGTNTLAADGGNNELFAGAGNDYLSASGGGNYLDGGSMSWREKRVAANDFEWRMQA